MSISTQQPSAHNEVTALMSSLAITSTSALQPLSSEQIFLPFPRLPIELRLRIWKSSFVPRFVALTSATLDIWDFPRDCRPDCDCREEHPFKEGVPAILKTCRESRSEGLKFYKLFRTAKFESGYVNLEIDTLHFADCRHRGNGPHFDIDWNPKARLVTDGKLEERVIAMLACEPQDVKDITSLAICGCQTSFGRDNRYRRGGRTSKARRILTEELRKYEKLSSIFITHGGSREFVEALGSDGSRSKDGEADLMRKGPDGEYATDPATDAARSVMWDSIELAARFENFVSQTFGGKRRQLPRVSGVSPSLMGTLFGSMRHGFQKSSIRTNMRLIAGVQRNSTSRAENSSEIVQDSIRLRRP